MAEVFDGDYCPPQDLVSLDPRHLSVAGWYSAQALMVLCVNSPVRSQSSGFWARKPGGNFGIELQVVCDCQSKQMDADTSSRS